MPYTLCSTLMKLIWRTKWLAEISTVYCSHWINNILTSMTFSRLPNKQWFWLNVCITGKKSLGYKHTVEFSWQRVILNKYLINRQEVISRGAFINYVYNRRGLDSPQMLIFVNVHKVEKCQRRGIDGQKKPKPCQRK